MNYTGQSLSDRFQAARHTLLGSALGRGVCKATTEELGAPKKKHLEYLKQCTYEANVSIPQLVELLIDRTRTTSWVVTFKALISIHYLLNYGNERFGSCFATCGHKLNLSKFFDRSSLIGFEMSPYIRKYAAYIDSKRDAHRIAGNDLCRVKRGKEDGFLRKLSTDKLFRTLGVLSNPIDYLTQFSITKAEVMNTIIVAAYSMLCKDAVRLYACYNDGIISLLEKFFDLPSKECAEALELYRGFLKRSDNLSQFLKNAETCGFDRGGIPDLIKAPCSLLDTLQNHLQGLRVESVSTSQPNQQRSTKFESELITFFNVCNTNDQKLNEFSNKEKLMSLEDNGKLLARQSGSNHDNVTNTPYHNNSLTNDLLDLNFGWDTAVTNFPTSTASTSNSGDVSSSTSQFKPVNQLRNNPHNAVASENTDIFEGLVASLMNQTKSENLETSQPKVQQHVLPTNPFTCGETTKFSLDNANGRAFGQSSTTGQGFPAAATTSTTASTSLFSSNDFGVDFRSTESITANRIILPSVKQQGFDTRNITTTTAMSISPTNPFLSDLTDMKSGDAEIPGLFMPLEQISVGRVPTTTTLRSESKKNENSTSQSMADGPQFKGFN